MKLTKTPAVPAATAPAAKAAKGAKVPAPKAGKNPAPKAVAPATTTAPFKGRETVLAAVGLRGVVLCVGKLSSDSGSFQPLRDHNGVRQDFSPRPIKLGESVPAVWKGNGAESLSGKAIGAYVSPAGEKYRLFTLDGALKSKVIKPVTFRVNGKARKCYVPSGWTEKQLIPQYIGAETPLGRWEHRKHPDGEARQGGAHAKVELA